MQNYLMITKVGRCVLAGLAALILNTGASAIDALLTDDTCTARSRAPQGAAQVLQVSDTARTYLKFRFDTVLPEGTRGVEIARATLRVWIRAKPGIVGPQPNPTHPLGQTVPGLAVYPLLSDWSEATLISSNAPTHGAEAFRDFILGREKAFYDIDLTNLVREWIAGQRPNFGIVLAGVAIQDLLPTESTGVPSRFSIDSKENQSSSHEPRLQIVLRSVPPEQEGEIFNPSVTNLPFVPSN